MNIRQIIFSGLIGLGFISTHAMAGIALDSTRIVFNESDIKSGKSIGLTNSGSSAPYLVKAQVLNDVQGQNANTPFVVTPSLFRLEPSATNQIRIMKATEQLLPKDKESVFYLRVMATPAGELETADAQRELGGAIRVSTGNIIKFFYRPSGLPMTHTQAMGGLYFSRQGNELKVDNPSPYFVTLSSLKVNGKAVPLSVQKQNTMISPRGYQTYTIANPSGNVIWKAINDYGGTEVFHGVVQ